MFKFFFFFFFSLEPKKVLPRLLEQCLGREGTGGGKEGVIFLYHSCPQILSPGSVKCLMAVTVWEIFLEDLTPISISYSNYHDDDNNNSHDGADYFEHPPWANQCTVSATNTVSNQYINPKRQTFSLTQRLCNTVQVSQSRDQNPILAAPKPRLFWLMHISLRPCSISAFRGRKSS